MDNDTIVELLERLGYQGARLEAMCTYLSEFKRRRAVLEGGDLGIGDIVTATLIFDGFNRKHKGN